MAELLTRPVLVDYHLLDTSVCDVRLLRVKPSDDGETRVEGDTLYARAEPYKEFFSGKCRDILPPYHDIMRWGKDARVVAYRIAGEPVRRSMPSWGKVLRLYEDVVNDRLSALLDFYQSHGPLGYYHYVPSDSFGWQTEWYWEPLGWVRNVLEVINGLSTLVRSSLSEREDRLRPLFGEPRETTASEITLAGRLGADFPWVITWEARPKEIGKETYRIPEDDELVNAAWEAVLEWFRNWFTHTSASGLQHGVLTAIPRPKERRIELALQASTLIEYVVARFYLDEVAGGMGSCQRCGRPLAVTKKECKRCADARRQAKRRDKIRRADEVLGMARSKLPMYLARLRRRLDLTDEQKRTFARRLEQWAEKYSIDEFMDKADRLLPSRQGQR